MQKCLSTDPSLTPELFNLFLEHAPVAVAMFDRQMRYLFTSRQWLSDYGLGNQNIIGRSHYEVFPNLPNHWPEVYQRCLGGAVERCDNDRLMRPDGTEKWVKWEVRPWQYPTGEVGGLIVSTEFITSALLTEETLSCADIAVTLQQLQREIGDRQRTEEALTASEARFQKLAANMPGAIYQFLLRPDGSKSIVYISSGCRDLYELEPEEIQQDYQRLWALIHPEDLAALQQSIFTSAETLKPRNHEARIITPSGKLKWIQSVSRPEKLEGGGILWDGLLLDITKRKRAEEQLQQYKEHLEELVLARTAALTQANQQLTMLNRLANQIRNSLDLNTIQQTLVDEIRELLQLDRCHITWHRPRLTPPAWEVVTEAKATNLSSHVGCYPSTEIGSVSETLLRLELIREDAVETLSNPVRRRLLLSLGYRAILALPIQTQTGEVIILSCIHCSTSRQWTDDEVELLQAVMAQLAIAITHAELYEKTCTKAQELEQALEELRRTQSQLVQTEKMSSLGQLVAGIAHEINNPVSFIYGNVGHASDYIQDLLRLLECYRATYPQPTLEIEHLAEEIELDFLVEDLPKLLDSMAVGATRIQEIVRSLRTFSRVDESERKPINLHEDIDNTLLILGHRLKATAGHPPIEVIKDYGNLPLVECYAGLMNQVFMNLLSNAIDALEERNQQGKTDNIEDSNFKPEITIKTRVTNSNWVSIIILDNGAGIPSDVISKIFDLFFTTKPIGKGTGLGLAISYQIIVEKHGGRLHCHSVPGTGTEFFIQIPINMMN